MRIRRAVGAATLALTVAATLSSCTDNPQDKAFGGFGDAPPPPTMPNPSLSLDPDAIPDVPGGTTGGTSGGTTGGTSGGSGPTPAPTATYNPDATSEVVGENCRYNRSASQMSFDVDIQNSATDSAFRYSFSVVFKVGETPDSLTATRTIDTRFQTATVAPGGSRTITVHTSHSTNEGLRYSCQVQSATKVRS